jgi:hypothetical protein
VNEFRSLPAEVQTGIKAKALADWPTDYEMQLHSIEEQSRSFLEYSHLKNNTASNDLLEKLFGMADEKWSDDYVMRLHEFRSQLDAAGQFFDFAQPGVPEEILEEIKIRALSEWDHDFVMCFHQLENQVAAWIKLNQHI